MIWLKRTATQIIICLIVFQSADSFASEREYAIKAGFLYNFARYSEGDWFTPKPSTSYQICSTDSNFINIAKKTLAGQRIKGQPLQFKQITQPEPDCHSLFISAASNLPPSFLSNPVFQTTMRIGESKGFIQAGGHLNFFIAGGKIRFEASPSNLKQAHIKMSSKVLRMGRTIKETEK